VVAVHPTVLSLLELPNPSSPTAWGAAVAALDEGDVPWPAAGSAAVPGVYLHSLAMNKTAFRALARRAVALDDPRGAKLARSLNAIADTLVADGDFGAMSYFGESEHPVRRKGDHEHGPPRGASGAHELFCIEQLLGVPVKSVLVAATATIEVRGRHRARERERARGARARGGGGGTRERAYVRRARTRERERGVSREYADRIGSLSSSSFPI
jgi:hypothetical protein